MTSFRLTLLAAATFLYVTFETFPIGLIREISRDLHVSQAQIGLLTSGYAVVAGVATIPSVRLAQRWSRKHAVLGSLVALAVAEILAAAASNYPMMVASRIVAALTHGILWSLVAPLAATLVPRARVAMATSAVFAGATSAAVLGAPLSTLLGQLVGWRVAAGALAVTSVAIFAALSLILPSDGRSDTHAERVSDESARGIAAALGPHWRVLLVVYAIAIVVVFAHFTSYTYFTLLVTRATGGGAFIVAELAAFGVAGGVATYLTGRFADTSPARVTLLGAVALTLGTGGLAVALQAPSHPVAVLVLTLSVVLWGGAIAALGPSYQSAVMRAAGPHEDTASAVYVTCYQIGIASGSACGAAAVSSSLGLLPAVSVIAATLALAATVRFRAVYTAPG